MRERRRKTFFHLILNEDEFEASPSFLHLLQLQLWPKYDSDILHLAISAYKDSRV